MKKDGWGRSWWRGWDGKEKEVRRGCERRNPKKKVEKSTKEKRKT